MSEETEREIVSALLAGETNAKIRKRFEISARSVQRVLRKRSVWRV